MTDSLNVDEWIPGETRLTCFCPHMGKLTGIFERYTPPTHGVIDDRSTVIVSVKHNDHYTERYGFRSNQVQVKPAAKP